ncbi:hypothetical protein acsn021_41560 [Anaerocolumna cellulosilytica]|uniref:Uncharacterized protein n=1 Tax=Anaerocolumna cellulosilytica TaxID=433286 RepID=A0A6S6R8Z1_9FIRM|nr:N-acetylmuramoyl-L-alanine amidase [Anaerocolumna cellulosilytica]MBB5197563.1 N-acetylmuramoyl-L-alanine amidase [Anaerocolumna cellulosilytica]BCJ96587.1 hypothetical protein acsn021_41560 [Anaerocolumna cellulosilytica]
MEDRLIKKTVTLSVLMMLLVAGLSSVISHYGQGFAKAGSNITVIFSFINQWNQRPLKNGEMPFEINSLSDEVSEQLGDKFLLIQKSEKDSYEIKLEEQCMKKVIILTIKNLKTKDISTSSIYRKNYDYWFSGVPDKSNTGFMPAEQEVKIAGETYNNDKSDELLLVPEVIAASGDKYPYGGGSQDYITDPLRWITINYTETGSGTYTAEIQLGMDYIYAPSWYEDENNIYLSLKTPKDVYSTIVVIDAGHGGKDVGASSKDERYYEKDINLSIMKHLRDVLEKKNIKVYYTRDEDETIYLNPRVNLANEVEADLFLSIHCNSNESAAPSGSEVLYNENQSGKDFLSKEFAQIVLDEIVGLTGKMNRGLVPSSEIVVVGKANMPVALVETAFMSNTKELQFLIDEKNQIKIAKALSRAIDKAISKLK